MSNKDVFSKGLENLGCLKGFSMPIKLLPGVQPYNSRPYKTPRHLLPVLNDRIKNLLDAGVIEPSFSNFTAPCLLVSKKTKEGHTGPKPYRLCIDYRKINTLVEAASYPHPTLTEFTEYFAERCKGPRIS